MSILQMSISAGFLVIAIVVMRAVALNRLPKTMFLVLWGIVLLRLLLPITIPSQYSIYTIINSVLEQTAPEAAAPIIENILPIENQVIKVITPESSADTTEAIDEVMRIVTPMQEKVLDISPITIIWLAGMLVTLIFFAVVYFRSHRELRCALPICDNEYLNNWLAENKLSRTISILQSDRLTSPVAVGLARPRIILPKSMDMDDKQLLQHVLTHEYCHIKRFDILWKLLLAFAICVHWFNPLVWAMFVLANRDLELTCDEMVLRHIGAGIKTAYAYSIIGMAENRSGFAPLYNGFSKNAAEERIVAIMKYKKSSLAVIALAMFLVTGTTIVFAMNAAVSKNSNVNPPNMQNSLYGKDEKSIEDYFQYGISPIKSGGYSYNGQRIRLFVDEWEDGSFELCFIDEMGTVDLQTVTRSTNVVINIENMPAEKSDSMLADMLLKKPDVAPYRLTISELPDNLVSWVKDCDKEKGLNAIAKNRRWYVYCNTIPNDFAWQIDDDTGSENGSIVNLYDIGSKGDGYALLSIPYCDNIQVLYKNEKVQFSDSGPAATTEKKRVIQASDDNNEFLMKYFQRGEYVANDYKESIDGYNAALSFSDFTGSKVIFEMDFKQDTDIGFRMKADVEYLTNDFGEYKIAFISEENQILMAGSAYNGYSAERPFSCPKGKVQVALIGERISGSCEVTLSMANADSSSIDIVSYGAYGISKFNVASLHIKTKKFVTADGKEAIRIDSEL